jgi:hypothetical protein
MAIDHASIELLAVHDGVHAVQLLLASERIQHDLVVPSSLSLIVRQYLTDHRRCRSEFRAFVYQRHLTALTQYNEYVLDRYVVNNRDRILNSIETFFHDEHVLDKLPNENCVLDLILVENDERTHRVYICEVNPLAEFAGTGLFSWMNDREILLGRQPFEFRINEHENKHIDHVNSQWLSLIDNH